MTAPPLSNEAARLDALRALALLDTPAESDFDDLTKLAATICHTPLATLSLVDRDRLWLKSRFGPVPAEVPRVGTFCDHTIRSGGLFVVADAAADERFRDHPAVAGDPHLRFYAGVPLTQPDGHAVGTLCVLDRAPRTLAADQLEALRVLARQAVAQLLLRRQVVALSHQADQARERAKEQETFRVLFEHSSDAHLIFDERDGIIDCNHAAVAMLRCRDKSQVLALHPAVLSPEFQPCGRRSLEKCVDMDAAARRHGFHRFDWTHRRADGEDFPCEVTITPVQLHGRHVLLVVWHDLTDRKRAEATQRECEGLFRLVWEQSADGMRLTDAGGTVLMANPAYCRLIGRPAGEVVGRPFTEAYADSGRADGWAKYHRRFTSRAPRGQTEVEVVLLDGSRRWFAVADSYLDLPDRPPLLLTVFRDVTDRRRAEDALRASEDLLRSAFDGAAIGMALVSPDGRWLRVNRSMTAFLGYSPEELLVTDFQTLTHPDDLAADMGLVLQVLAGEIDTYQLEKRYVHKDGRTLHAMLSVSLVRDAAGDPLYFVSQVKDISLRRAAEDALRQSEERFRLVVDRLAEGLFVVDPATGRIVEANAAMLGMLGYTTDEFAGLTLTDLVAGESADEAARLARRVGDSLARDGRCDLGRRHLRRKDGSTVPVEVRVTLVPAAGAGLHAVVVRDVTEQVAYEGRLFDYQSELEEANAKLKALAVTDGLTGVRNRAAFNDRLTEEYDRATRADRPLSLLMMDVDHFKAFNDSFGHPAGDDVLKVVARTLVATVRITDFVARYGGEEFAVILPDTDFAGAMVLAERCRRAVAGASWKLRAVTVSVGVATLSADALEPVALVQQADQALYQSKATGRNRVQFGSGATLLAASCHLTEPAR